MTTIDGNKEICTLINVFSVDPEKHHELFELPKEATENVMSSFRDVFSANLHISNDKKTITNYAQWASLSDFKNMLVKEEGQVHMKKAASVATEFRPVT